MAGGGRWPVFCDISRRARSLCTNVGANDDARKQAKLFRVVGSSSSSEHGGEPAVTKAKKKKRGKRRKGGKKKTGD